MAVTGQEDIARLNVAMNDAVSMSCLQASEDLSSKVKQPQYLQRSFSRGFRVDQLLDGLTFEQRHHDERLALVLPEFINGTDVGMLQLRSGAGFTLEPSESMRLLGRFFTKELDC